jgi:hypothetical protein
MNQNPLGSPWAAESHESSLIGPDGVTADVEVKSPKKEAICTLLFLIGRNSHRSGMFDAVRLIDAARSGVRLRQLAFAAHSSGFVLSTRRPQ